MTLEEVELMTVEEINDLSDEQRLEAQELLLNVIDEDQIAWVFGRGNWPIKDQVETAIVGAMIHYTELPLIDLMSAAGRAIKTKQDPVASVRELVVAWLNGEDISQPEPRHLRLVT